MTDAAIAALPFGWLTDEEAAVLADLARGRRVLELGAYVGRSTVALARTATLVVSVDHHRGSPEHQVGESTMAAGTQDAHDPLRIDTAPFYLSNLSQYGVRDRVCAIIADTAQVLPLLAPGTFGLVFVDGAHDFASVVRDGRLAVPLLRRRGVMVFHDGPTVARGIEAVALATPRRRVTPLAGSLIALMP